MGVPVGQHDRARAAAALAAPELGAGEAGLCGCVFLCVVVVVLSGEPESRGGAVLRGGLVESTNSPRRYCRSVASARPNGRTWRLPLMKHTGSSSGAKPAGRSAAGGGGVAIVGRGRKEKRGREGEFPRRPAAPDRALAAPAKDRSRGGPRAGAWAGGVVAGVERAINRGGFGARAWARRSHVAVVVPPPLPSLVACSCASVGQRERGRARLCVVRGFVPISTARDR